MSLGPEERLQAIEIASQWNSSTTLELFRRGLKDTESKIVMISAAAIDKKKGFKAKTTGNNNQTRRPPRNAFLMR